MSWQRRDSGRRRSASIPSDDHVHPEYWTEEDHHRFEGRMGQELHGIRTDLKSLGRYVTLFMGALGLLAFLGPIVVVIVLRFFLPPGGQ